MAALYVTVLHVLYSPGSRYFSLAFSYVLVMVCLYVTLVLRECIVMLSKIASTPRLEWYLKPYLWSAYLKGLIYESIIFQLNLASIILPLVPSILSVLSVYFDCAEILIRHSQLFDIILLELGVYATAFVS